MDTSGINRTHIRLDRWYRRSLTCRKYHLVDDLSGDTPDLKIHTKCGLEISGDAGLLDWTTKPQYDKCKICARKPIKTPQEEKPKIIWAAAINLSGLWGPFKMKLHEDQQIYYDRTGNFSVNDYGLMQTDGIVTYGSPSQKATEIWVSGVKTTMRMLKRWCQYDL